MNQNSPMKSTKKLFSITEEIRRRDGANANELASALDMPKSTIYRHLQTLHELEYLVKEGEQYQIGIRFLYIGMGIYQQNKSYTRIEPSIEELATETGERAQFMIEEHGRLAYVYRQTGQHAVHTDTQIGKPMPLHATSGGKAILAKKTDKKISAIIAEKGLPKITENTITNEDSFWNEIEQIRDSGVSFNNQEYTQGLRSVAVPIVESNGQPLGSIGISGPSNRLKGGFYSEKLPDLLLGVANEIELNLEYS